MPLFRYEGFDQSGGRVNGVLDAVSLGAATHELRSRGVMPSRVVEAGSEPDWKATLGLASDSVSLSELEFFTAELSLLLDSGVRIDRAIGILQRAGKGGAVSRLLSELSAELKSGRQLSEAVAEHPEVFDRLYVNLVALGEAGGRLPEVFRGLAEDLKFRRELRQKIISAATYPLVVAAVCVIAILFIFNFVVPNLEGLFADATELPWYTTMLLESSRFMRQWQGLLGIFLAAGGAVLWRMRENPSVVEFKDQILLDTPGLRDATAMVERIRFCSGLGLMLDAGLPVDRALTLATGCCVVRCPVRSIKSKEESDSPLYCDKRACFLTISLHCSRLAKRADSSPKYSPRSLGAVEMPSRLGRCA
jgi:type II secretory pathway component PulF